MTRIENNLSNSEDDASRRDWMKKWGLTAGATALLAAESKSSTAQAAHHGEKEEHFKYCLNMSTIRGQELDAAEEIEIAGKSGYDSIEPWFRKINAYVEAGGSLKDLKKRIDDHGLTVESAIGFAPWIVNDPEKRAQGLEEAKRDMDTLAQLGGMRIAAPPAGSGKNDLVSLDDAATRYRALLELGDKMGVTPQIEMWGGHPVIGTVEKAIYVAIRAGHPQACFLGDVYHTYKGGSSFDAILMLSGRALKAYHMNDYPADPPQDTIKDEHRVFPGDGIAPMKQIFQNFRKVGAYPALSLELFNREYWKMPALECAKVGLEKMKKVVSESE